MAKKFLSRDGYLAEGGRLLKRLQREGTAAAQKAYVDWHDRAKPTTGEMEHVLTIARGGSR